MKTTQDAQPLDTGLRRREECGTGSTPVELIPEGGARRRPLQGWGPAGRGAL
jgi:hypothetical protein